MNGRFFKDKDGHIAIWQMPNVPLIGWGVTKAASMLLGKGGIGHGLDLLSAAFLFTWAYLEITSGISGFRRLFGALVIIATTIGLFTR